MKTESEKRVGIFGGSFNPIHNGHLTIAKKAMEACGLSEVRFIPAGDPYMKRASDVLPALTRLHLTELAVEGLPGFTADPMEVLQEGASYTADTLSQLHEAEPDSHFFLIVGRDAFMQMPLWKDPARILELADIVVADRKESADVPEHGTIPLNVPEGRLHEIEVNVDISSTDIRRRILNGDSVKGLVPERAEEEIVKIYRDFLSKKDEKEGKSILKKEGMMAVKAFCKMGTLGQEVVRFELAFEGDCPEKEEILVTGPFRETAQNKYLKETRGEAPGDVKELSLEDGLLSLDVVPFTNRSDYTLTIGEKTIEKADVDETITDGLDAFERIEEGELLYRLYSPAAEEKRPLILFLHGGGNGGPKDGRDNERQLLADYGPINFSQDYPDCFVLAPQCIEQPFNMAMMGGVRKQSFFKDMDPNFGWSRAYLSKVCDVIRRMIREGKVDEKRVYVTGLSMGGAGTIRAMSVGSDLFAACAPVCPTMTQETFNILRTIEAPVWVSSAYVDHTVYR
ncbi:MAG: nicotinate-nucleotide adenylyltransferase, partial [Lachnospiraceae bacterium]|nr:nicotinate-nucleotide adenylyltransferase [Lachnospiraceae bacterium]